MKKLFALILAVVMICAMSVSVFAADEKKSDHIVGDRKGGSYTDGATDSDFNTSSEKSYQVKIEATVGTVENRYAVDIEYDELVFTVTGTNLVWNVNTLKYELGSDGVPADAETKEFNVAVINYSDLDVELTVNVVDERTEESDDAARVYSNFNNGNGNTITLQSAVGKVLDENANDYIKNTTSANSFKVIIEPENGNTWADVANYYTNYFAEQGNDPVTMGTLNITVAKVSSGN